MTRHRNNEKTLSASNYVTYWNDGGGKGPFGLFVGNSAREIYGPLFVYKDFPRFVYAGRAEYSSTGGPGCFAPPKTQRAATERMPRDVMAMLTRGIPTEIVQREFFKIPEWRTFMTDTGKYHDLLGNGFDEGFIEYLESAGTHAAILHDTRFSRLDKSSVPEDRDLRIEWCRFR